MDKSILDCNLKLGLDLLKLQDETAGTSHTDIDQDDVSLAGMLQGAWCSWSCSLLLFHPSVRASLLSDNTGARRRFSNTSASRGQVDAVFAPVQIGFYAQSWSYFSGVDFGRSEHVLFIFKWQNELCDRVGSFPPTFVLQVADIVLPMCDKMVWLAVFTERYLSQPIITYRGAKLSTVSRVGKHSQSLSQTVKLPVATIVSAQRHIYISSKCTSRPYCN